MSYIFLSYPILDRPEFQSTYSMYQSILSCREHRVRLFANQNDSLISRVRNVHMSLFLDEYKECEYFISLDSDLEIVNCYHTNNIFTKLLSHNVDFVGGLYALKHMNGPARTSSVPLEHNLDRTAIPFDQGLLPMRWLSAGCWCLKRSAVEKMVKAYPELDYIGDDNVVGRTIHGLYNPGIFEIEDESTGKKFKKYLSEDWSWAERWRKIGGEIYADTSIVLRHIGRFPYSLWNVEVIAKKADEVNQQPTQPTQPTIAPNSLKIEPINKTKYKETFGLPPLPTAGWNLNKKF